MPPVDSLQIAFFDTETTGLDPDQDQIVEVACIRAYIDMRGNPLDVHTYSTNHCLYDWSCPMGQKAQETHGIDKVMIHEHGREGVYYKDNWRYWDTLTHRCNLLVAHNAEFDGAFLNLPEQKRWLCTKDLAYALLDLPEVRQYSNRGLAEHFLNKYRPSHRASADILATYETFLRLLQIRSAYLFDTLSYASTPKKKRDTMIRFLQRIAREGRENPRRYEAGY